MYVYQMRLAGAGLIFYCCSIIFNRLSIQPLIVSSSSLLFNFNSETISHFSFQCGISTNWTIFNWFFIYYHRSRLVCPRN